MQREIRSVLNKLAPQKFDELMKQVDTVELDSEEKLVVTIDLIFEKVCSFTFSLTKLKNKILLFVIAYSKVCFSFVLR